eukprot:UN25726
MRLWIPILLSNKVLHDFKSKSNPKKELISNCNYLFVAGIVVLIFVFQIMFQDSIVPKKSNAYMEVTVGEFCIWNHMVPSILGVGVQKCGTTTIDRLLDQFHNISHGKQKEHHYFDQTDPEIIDTPSIYWKNFPQCDENKSR